MSQYDYDLLVIGAGSGGVRASRTAARLGARVAVVEERYLGGTCVNVGCVPKKLLVYASHYAETFQVAPGFGWHLGATRFDWSELLANKDREIARLNEVYRGLLQNTGVTLFEARARVLGPNRVAVGDREITAERILIAVGGWPWKPDIPGIDLAITSNEAFYLNELPASIVIVGGGYIAVEFAGIFNGLGVDTHLCYRGDLFLRGFDKDVRDHAASELRKKGITLHFNTEICSIAEEPGGGYRIQTDVNEEWCAGLVMYATGRQPMIDDLGLEHTAVQITEAGTIAVDEFMQTHEPSIYALGDVTGPVALTPVALAQGQALAQNLYGGDDIKLSYKNIPAAVFSQPTIATVGLTEEEARASYERIDIYKSSFGPMQYSLSAIGERALIKLVVDRDTDRVLGCHMVGPDAGEIVQGLAVALTAGATKADFDRTIGIHPTLAEEFVTLRQVAE
ncbi:glutathione-disulfide reductase [Marinimicrobium sp. ABcell2]|uniref:glutathione-disulfide reductase n=1 Tax=Marinimicrobium sp. ABcell2 TaxID=3069751 RepID=UPI0027AF2A19|nr:glutathione-disulfide reductase [Marinimicrobium sp. ABcell2]MDQ2075452.1 glutathione-disulfide reductase [Marinimicrobium sp. ABcell2]